MTEKGGQGSAAPTKVARIQSPRGVSVRLEAVAVNELLQGTARGLMRLGGVLQENEGIAKGGVQGVGRITHHRQATALEGAVGAKGRDDDVPPGLSARLAWAT